MIVLLLLLGLLVSAGNASAEVLDCFVSSPRGLKEVSCSVVARRAGAPADGVPVLMKVDAPMSAEEAYRAISEAMYRLYDEMPYRYYLMVRKSLCDGFPEPEGVDIVTYRNSIVYCIASHTGLVNLVTRDLAKYGFLQPGVREALEKLNGNWVYSLGVFTHTTSTSRFLNFMYAAFQDRIYYRLIDAGDYYKLEVINEYKMRPEDLKQLFGEVAGVVYSSGGRNVPIYEIARRIHDWEAKHIAYDRGTFSYSSIESEVEAFGVFLNGVGVCAGYSDLYSWLLNIAGIKARILGGEVWVDANSRREGHAWNMVQIGNDWFHVDVTWDSLPHRIRHKYFLVTDAFMKSEASGSRTWNNAPAAVKEFDPDNYKDLTPENLHICTPWTPEYCDIAGCARIMGKWDWQAGRCIPAYADAEGLRCSEEHPELCDSEEECKQVGGYWIAHRLDENGVPLFDDERGICHRHSIAYWCNSMRGIYHDPDSGYPSAPICKHWETGNTALDSENVGLIRTVKYSYSREPDAFTNVNLIWNTGSIFLRSKELDLGVTPVVYLALNVNGQIFFVVPDRQLKFYAAKDMYNNNNMRMDTNPEFILENVDHIRLEPYESGRSLESYALGSLVKDSLEDMYIACYIDSNTYAVFHDSSWTDMYDPDDCYLEITGEIAADFYSHLFEKVKVGDYVVDLNRVDLTGFRGYIEVWYGIEVGDEIYPWGVRYEFTD